MSYEVKSCRIDQETTSASGEAAMEQSLVVIEQRPDFITTICNIISTICSIILFFEE